MARLILSDGYSGATEGDTWSELGRRVRQFYEQQAIRRARVERERARVLARKHSPRVTSRPGEGRR